ncbi:MAG: hypothetical protein ACK4UJ_11870 [Leptonema sp. (in: bacteria)]
MNSIYISHLASDVDQLLKEREIQNNFLKISGELKKELSIPLNKKIIVTGHQPILYYPGIFVKLILASEIAKKIQGNAYYLVLDTDKVNIDWKFIFFQNDYYREDKLLNDPKRILLKQYLEGEKKEILLNSLERWQLELYHIFEPSFVPKVQFIINLIKEFLYKSKKIQISNFSVFLNSIFLEQLSLQIKPIFLSDIINTNTYKLVFEFIKSNHKKFNKIYNTILNDFRKENNIKNLSIPFPNLKEDELPFWLSDSYNRKTFNFKEKDLYPLVMPKAIVISLIIRGFLSDLMVHGLGGGFYDLVVERILEEFLGFKISPFIKTTCSVTFPMKASILLNFQNKQEILNEIRCWKFNPEIFISEGCILKKQKIYLYNLKNYYDNMIKKTNKQFEDSILKNKQLNTIYKELLFQIEKNIEHYPEIIHKEILKINHKLHLNTLKHKKDLYQKLKKRIKIEKYQNIFLDRTLPIFYFDIQNLYEKYIGVFNNLNL